jgi:toxin ParE1/3/4
MTESRLPPLWSPEALSDIDQLWDYYAGVAGRATADKILREVGKAVALIAEYPHAGRSRDELRAGLRSLAANPQVVFYRLREDRPEIVRVLDGRQDIGEIFSDEDGT